MANIAVNIKRLRLQKGITQEAFAKTVNVSRPTRSWRSHNFRVRNSQNDLGNPEKYVPYNFTDIPYNFIHKPNPISNH